MSNLSDLNFSEQYKTAMVTGAAGFIGSHIVERLLSMKVKVIAVDNLSAGRMTNIPYKKSNYYIFYDYDISNKNSMNKVFKNHKIDIIFNNAASKKNICLLNPARDLEVNTLGTLNLLELSVEFSVSKFIHASSGSVYGEAKVIPQTEEHPIDPVSYYGVSKLAGERYVKVFNHLHGLNTTILRYFHVYGPRQDSKMDTGGVISIFINRALRNEPIFIHGDGSQERSFTYVKDVVDANIIVAKSKQSSGEFYNVASGININLNDLKDVIIEKTDSKSDVIYDDWLIGDIKKFNISNSKIKNLGLNFTDFIEGLDETINIEMKTDKNPLF